MPARRARQLRLTMTDAERRLWAALRGRRLQNYKFRRQHPLGPFILDFACIAHRLAIEADGGQHTDNDHDRHRTAWLARRGWRVVRFWNNDILANPEGVQEAILAALQESRPSDRTAKTPHPPGLRPGPSLSHANARERGKKGP